MAFGGVASFIILPNHQHRRSFHLLIFSSISFTCLIKIASKHCLFFFFVCSFVLRLLWKDCCLPGFFLSLSSTYKKATDFLHINFVPYYCAERFCFISCSKSPGGIFRVTYVYNYIICK